MSIKGNGSLVKVIKVRGDFLMSEEGCVPPGGEALVRKCKTPVGRK